MRLAPGVSTNRSIGYASWVGGARADHPSSPPAPSARLVGRLKAVEPTQAEGRHGDDGVREGKSRGDAVRADEPMGSPDNLDHGRPQHRTHSARTVPLRTCDSNVKFIHLSTAIHIDYPHRERWRCQARKANYGRAFDTFRPSPYSSRHDR